MSEAAKSASSSDAAPRWAPPSPVAVLVPGVLLLFAGLWMVTDGGPLPVGWACFVVGLALLLVGAVAWGVAWGLGLHADDQP
jgi:hypothetical protein